MIKEVVFIILGILVYMCIMEDKKEISSEKTETHVIVKKRNRW